MKMFTIYSRTERKKSNRTICEYDRTSSTQNIIAYMNSPKLFDLSKWSGNFTRTCCLTRFLVLLPVVIQKCHLKQSFNEYFGNFVAGSIKKEQREQIKSQTEKMGRKHCILCESYMEDSDKICNCKQLCLSSYFAWANMHEYLYKPRFENASR